jgi:hypothetical protein
MNVQRVFLGRLPETDGEVIGLVEFSSGDGRALVLQFPGADLGEEDEEFATYCISTEKGYSNYGGIEAVRLDDLHGLLYVLLTQEASAILDLPKVLELKMDIPSSERRELYRAMRRLLPQYGTHVEGIRHDGIRHG